jgi:hypothetical protein
MTKNTFPKILSVICLSLTVTTTSWAQNQNFCDSVDGLNRLSSYVFCQNQVSIAACAGLGAVTGGYAGKFALKSAKASIESSIEKTKAAIAEKIEKNYLDAKRVGINPRIYDPESKSYISIEVDKYPNFSSLPAEQQTAWASKNREAIKLLASAAKDGKIPSSDELARRLYEKFPPAPDAPAWDNISARYTKDVYRALAKSALGGLEEASGGDGTVAGIQRSAAWILARLGAKSPLIGGGVFGLALLATTETLRPTQTGCMDSLGDDYITRDSSSKNCAIKHEFSENVLKTLDLSPENQKRALSIPAVCDFYKKLHDKTLAVPKFKSLECKSQGFNLKTTASDGSTLEHQAQYFYGSQKVRQINFQNSEATDARWNGPLEVNADGSIKNIASQYVAERAIPIRLYIEDAHSCCIETNDAEHEKCLAVFNGKTPQASTPGVSEKVR